MKNINLNINKEDYNINDFIVLYNIMGQRPNKISIYDTFSGNLFDDIINTNSSNTNLDNSVSELLPVGDTYTTNQKVLKEITDNIWCSFIRVNKDAVDYIINDVCIYYKTHSEDVDRIIDEISQCVIEYSDSKIDKFNTLSISSNSLEIEALSINSEVDINKNYNTETIKDIKHLIKKVNKSNKGISVFCGERGLGKTTIVKYFCSKIDRISIFIPNNLIDSTINNPEFKSFIKKFNKCLIIIDDCEFLTNSQFYKVNYFTNNVLQLVDGFLSDTLNVQVLMIFNEHIDNIDENILDSNNLIDVIEFEFLEPKIANSLSKSIGKNEKYKEPIKLVDIYSKSKKESQKKIGLK